MGFVNKVVNHLHKDLFCVVCPMTCIPWMFCLIAAVRGSMKMAKREGESGRPGLLPWCSVKLGEVILLVVIVALRDVYSVLIQ